MKMFSLEFNWPKEHACELVNPHLAINPVRCVRCVHAMCMCGDLTLGFNETAAIHCGHTYLTTMTGLYA